MYALQYVCFYDVVAMLYPKFYSQLISCSSGSYDMTVYASRSFFGSISHCISVPLETVQQAFLALSVIVSVFLWKLFNNFSHASSKDNDSKDKARS